MSDNDQTTQAIEEDVPVENTFVLPVGTLVQIELDGVTVRLNSVSVGYLPDHYLIIKQPSTGFGSISSKLYNGNKITIRYISGGDVFAFQSEVIGTMTDYPRLIFIAYPRRIVRRSLRGERRVLCYLPAEMLKDEPKKPGLLVEPAGGIISEMSASGCSFEMIKESSEQSLPDLRVNERIMLSVRLPGMEERIDLTGEVRRVNKDGKRLNVGVRFEDMDNDVKTRIASYVQTIEKYS